MASRFNTSAVSRDLGGDEEETRVARVKTGKERAKEQRRELEKWLRDTQKPCTPAAAPRDFNGERGSFQRNTSSETHNRSGDRWINTTSNWQNNRGWNRFKRNNGRPNVGRKINGRHYNRPHRGCNVEENWYSGGIVENLRSESNFSKDEGKEYRIKNWNSGGKRGYYRRKAGVGNSGRIREKWAQVCKEEMKEYRIKGSSSSATYMWEGGDEQLQEEDDIGETNARNGDVAVEASMEPEPKKEKQQKVLSQEEAERSAEMELEEKRMTLEEYEKQFQEKRKALESVKMEERKVIPDGEFESIQIVAKKSKESTSAVKKNTVKAKKKKAAMDKEESGFATFNT